MKNIFLLLILVSASFFSTFSFAAPEGIAVIDYRTVFFGDRFSKRKI